MDDVTPAARISFATRDPFAETTPAELRRHVLAALKERVLIGDRLAAGAVKVIEQLERQANTLAWRNTELVARLEGR